MLQKKARLSGPSVRYLLHKGKFFAHKFFTIRFLPTKNSLSRFSVIVSVKIEKKAVKRNRLRRQIYEIIRLNQNMLHCSYDMVFRVKNGIQELGYQELQKHIINIFQSINKFKK